MFSLCVPGNNLTPVGSAASWCLQVLNHPWISHVSTPGMELSRRLFVVYKAMQSGVIDAGWQTKKVRVLLLSHRDTIGKHQLRSCAHANTSV